MTSEPSFYTRVIVHAEVPARTADEAVGKLCERIREGIGDEAGGRGRPWQTAIAASLATADGEEGEVRANEEFMRRFTQVRP